jgi:hypothetical protein
MGVAANRRQATAIHHQWKLAGGRAADGVHRRHAAIGQAADLA